MYRKWISLVSASLATVCFALAGASVQAQCYPNNLSTCATCPSPVAALGYCGSGPGACCGYGHQGYPGFQNSYAARTPVRCYPGFESCADGNGLFGIRAMYGSCHKMNACGYGVYGTGPGCGCRSQCSTGCGLASPVIAPACCSPAPNCCAVMSNSPAAARTQAVNVAPTPTTAAPMPAYNTTAEPATVEPKPAAVDAAPAAAAPQPDAPKPGV